MVAAFQNDISVLIGQSIRSCRFGDSGIVVIVMELVLPFIS